MEAEFKRPWMDLQRPLEEQRAAKNGKSSQITLCLIVNKTAVIQLRALFNPSII